jgi:hypothetical protein
MGPCGPASAQRGLARQTDYQTGNRDIMILDG